MDLTSDTIARLSRHALSWTEFTSIALFILTALLLMLTYSLARERWVEFSAWAALGSATLAIQFMLLGWHDVAQPERGEMPGVMARRPDEGGKYFKECDRCPEMVVIQPGYFVMGATDAAAGPEEGPLRTMMIAKRFAIARVATTNAEFRAFMVATKRSPGACVLGPDAEPAQCVSFEDAQAFTAWLRRETGMAYRLASSAEWEYAGRAGSAPPTAATSAGVIKASLQSSVPQAVPAASGRNGFGVSGMGAGHGELVEDCWSPTLAELSADGRSLQGGLVSNCSTRVVKGGADYARGLGVRLSSRRPIAHNAGEPGVGFRVVRELVQLPRK